VATLRTCMLPPQETLRLFVTGAVALQGSRSSFGDFREAVPRVSDFFSVSEIFAVAPAGLAYI
jgi:hypothetical protein